MQGTLSGVFGGTNKQWKHDNNAFLDALVWKTKIPINILKKFQKILHLTILLWYYEFSEYNNVILNNISLKYIFRTSSSILKTTFKKKHKPIIFDFFPFAVALFISALTKIESVSITNKKHVILAKNYK